MTDQLSEHQQRHVPGHKHLYCDESCWATTQPGGQPTTTPRDEELETVSFCKSCYSSTHTVGGKCGKCGAVKSTQPTTMTVREQIEKILLDGCGMQSSHPYAADRLESLISNAKEEERRSIAKDFLESSGICSMHQLPDRSCHICFPPSSNKPKGRE